MKKKKNKILYKILMPIMLLASLFMFNGTYAIETEKTVTFEILTLSDGEGTVTSGTYQLFNEFSKIEDDYVVNLESVKFNNTETEIIIPFNYDSTLEYFQIIWEDDDELQVLITLYNDDTFIDSGDISVQLNDVFIITFLVDIEPQGTIIDVLSDWVGGFTTLIISVVQSMIPIFWLEGTGLTLVGILSLMAVGIGLIYLGLRFILQLFPGSHQL